MQKITFEDLPSTDTPLNAANMNTIQDNAEDAIAEAGVIVSPTEPVSDKKKVWLQHGKNLFNQSIITSTSGTIKYHAINVRPNTDYTLSTNSGTANSANVFLSTQNSGVSTANNGAMINSPRTINSENNTIMYVGYRNDLSSHWIQLEEGSTATEYEPYVEDKTYILNDNDVYQEFNNTIIDSGSNANGNYIKYSDGTMICTKKVQLSGTAVTTATGSLYTSSSLDLGNYPQEFIETPTVNRHINGTYAGWIYSVSGASASSAGSITIARATASSSSGANYSINIIAIGRWK